MSTPILKSLKADPDVLPPMTEHRPQGLSGSALEAWMYFETHTPYWWSVEDFKVVERYCTLLGVDYDLRQYLNEIALATHFDKYQRTLTMIKSMSLELKTIEYSLGVTPQGRAALKMSTPALGNAQRGGDDPGTSAGVMAVDDL